MRILVYGVGAVGGYIGAKIAKAGHDVTLLCRLETAKAISQQGLSIVKVDGQNTHKLLSVRPNLVTSLRQAFLDDTTYDLMIMGMKSYAVETAFNEMSAFVPQPPLMLTIQNGIGIEEEFVEQYGADKVIAGVVTTPLSLETRNIIVEERDDRGLALSPVTEGQDVEAWVELFNNAGILTELIPDYHSLKWSKVLLNMVGNASSAILNRHPKVIYNNEHLFNLEVEMLKEALAVMKKLKIKPVDLPGSGVKKLALGVKWMPKGLLQPMMAAAVIEGRGNKLPSFQLDLNAGKTQNEVFYHNGAIAKAGREVGAATPVNTVLASILLRIAAGKISRETYSGKPGALLKAVANYKKKEIGD